MDALIKKKIIVFVLLTINILFSFFLGLLIPLMESESKYFLGFLMIPLLIILNYIILERFHYYIKHIKE